MFTKASRKYAERAATIRSAASASEQPMPTAGPLTAAMTGLGAGRTGGVRGVESSGRGVSNRADPGVGFSLVGRLDHAPAELASPRVECGRAVHDDPGDAVRPLQL